MPNARFDWTRAYVCGVLNATPDSFSDGGAYCDVESACARAMHLVARGADLVDIGGESTRPGAKPVSAATEIERVVPVIQELARRGLGAPMSIDTTKAEVADAALAAGAQVVNDISGGTFDPDIVRVTHERGAMFICGHVRGASLSEVHAHEARPPSVEDVTYELMERVARLPVALRQRTIVDPCLGFGKGTWHDNAALIAASGAIGRATGCPVMVGPSRKRFVRALLERGAGSFALEAHAITTQELDAGTVGACLAAVAAGANFLRIHDVELLCPALVVYQSIIEPVS